MWPIVVVLLLYITLSPVVEPSWSRSVGVVMSCYGNAGVTAGMDYTVDTIAVCGTLVWSLWVEIVHMNFQI